MPHKNAKEHMRKYREDKTFLTITKAQAEELKKVKEKNNLESYAEVINFLLTVYKK